MKATYSLSISVLACCLCCGVAAGAESSYHHDVTWDSPSDDASGSMPLGNGDIGLNAWIEPGGVLMKTLQAMLLQPDPYSEKLYLLLAWPEDWNVKFKLHAPRQTTIECEFYDGEIRSLEVTPSDRRKEVVLGLALQRSGERGTSVP